MGRSINSYEPHGAWQRELRQRKRALWWASWMFFASLLVVPLLLWLLVSNQWMDRATAWTIGLPAVGAALFLVYLRASALMDHASRKDS